MQYVTDSSGQVHSFPDEATPEMIGQALGLGAGSPATGVPAPQQQSLTAAPPQDLSWRRYVYGPLEALGRSAVKLAGTPGDLLAATGLQTSPQQRADLAAAGGAEGIFPTTNELSDVLGRYGLLGDVTRTPGQGPFPEAEKLVAGGIEGVGSSLPYVLAGPEGLLARTAMTAGSGVAGELAHEYAPDVPFAPAAAGAITGGLTQIGRNVLAGNPLQRIATGLGSSNDLEDAGTALQKWGKAFRDPDNPSGMDAQLTAARAQLDSAVPSGTSVDHSQLLANAQELLARGGKAANAVRSFFSQTAGSGGERGDAAKLIQGNLAGAGLTPGLPATSLDWDASTGLRSELGAAYRSSRDPTERSALKFLYSGHTEDLGNAATAAGAGDPWQTFNKTSTDLHALNEGPVEDLLSNSDKPGSAANALLVSGRKQGTEIQALRDAGAPIGELSSAMLRANPGGWKNLSAGAKAALVQDPELVSGLDSLARPPSKLEKIGQSMGHIALGEGLGAGAAYLLGHGTPGAEILGQAAGAAVGAAAPHLYKAGLYPFRPNMLGAELVGGQSGRQDLPIPDATLSQP